MLSFLNLPSKLIDILEANISPREIAFGVCLGLFLGFTPLNGTTALLLALFFFIFKINRMATLLTMPLFKAVYLLGVSKLCDATGSYLLETATCLTGFWRVVTNFPVLAYLDINRTTVAGGIFLSAILSVPVYFIAKSVSASLLAKYSEKMQNSKFSKWVSGFKVVTQAGNLIGTDISSTIGNVRSHVQATVKHKVIKKIKSAILKPSKEKTGIMKRLNRAGIAAIIAALIVIQVGVGLIISPLTSQFIIDNLNRSGAAKILVSRINVWPLTLSLSMKELKVFDPKRSDMSILSVNSAYVHISPLALLSKRLVFSTVTMKGAQLDLVGAADGTYNVQHFEESKPEDQGLPNIMTMWRTVQEKKDLFGMIYRHIKDDFSKKGQEKAKKTHKDAKQVSRVTQDLPKGKLVAFKTPADLYLFEIRDLNIEGSVNIVPHNGSPVELKNARINLKRVAFDPQNGMRLDGASVKGELFNNIAAAGKIEAAFTKSYSNAGQTAVVKVGLDNVDLDAVRFVYEDSLPVHVAKGRISLSSISKITGDAIDSRNSMTLTGQTLEPKRGGASVVGYIPIAAVCDALNRIDPARLKFDITGTVEKPEFGGFQETLLGLIKPYIANIGEQVTTHGIDAAVNSLKSLFGNKK